MASDRRQKQSNSIPIRFFDGDDAHASEDEADVEDRSDPEIELDSDSADPGVNSAGFGGPHGAGLVSSRAGLKRLKGGLDEAKEALVRRPADFENYRTP